MAVTTHVGGRSFLVVVLMVSRPAKYFTNLAKLTEMANHTDKRALSPIKAKTVSRAVKCLRLLLHVQFIFRGTFGLGN